MRQRLDQVDAHGVVHRPGCEMPAWDDESDRVAGIHVQRCEECGAVRLVCGKP